MVAGSHAYFFWEALHGRVVAVQPNYAEWAMYLGGLLVTAHAARRARSFRNIGRARQVVLAGLVWSLLAGQVAGESRDTYPFVTWSMYTNPEPEPKYLELRARLASGRTVPFPLREVVPTTGVLPTRQGVVELLEGEDGESGEDRVGERPTRGAAVVTRLVDLYNRRNPEDPVVSLEILQHNIVSPDADPDTEVLASIRSPRVAGEWPR